MGWTRIAFDWCARESQSRASGWTSFFCQIFHTGFGDSVVTRASPDLRERRLATTVLILLLRLSYRHYVIDCCAQSQTLNTFCCVDWLTIRVASFTTLLTTHNRFTVDSTSLGSCPESIVTFLPPRDESTQFFRSSFARLLSENYPNLNCPLKDHQIKHQSAEKERHRQRGRKRLVRWHTNNIDACFAFFATNISTLLLLPRTLPTRDWRSTSSTATTILNIIYLRPHKYYVCLTAWVCGLLDWKYHRQVDV
jgi:hypothetical protein